MVRLNILNVSVIAGTVILLASLTIIHGPARAKVSLSDGRNKCKTLRNQGLSSLLFLSYGSNLLSASKDLERFRKSVSLCSHKYAVPREKYPMNVHVPKPCPHLRHFSIPKPNPSSSQYTPPRHLRRISDVFSDAHMLGCSAPTC